jgi:hypothetical protein
MLDESVEAARRAERDMIEQRRRAAARWPVLLDEIRQVPGFEDFALPPPMARLHEAAADGTVVAITVTAHGCGALLLTAHETDYVELPELSAQGALDNANMFLQAVNRTGLAGVDTAAVTQVLEWLWDAVTAPVLARLGFDAPPAETPIAQWPRVWWIPTGALSVLPIHAAGYHTDAPEKRRSVLDRVVSSYTPSVRALADARDAAGRLELSSLSVGIDKADIQGLPALQQAEHEATEVGLRLGATALLGAQATHAAVAAALPAASWAHFACHGWADQDDPAQSFLALFDQPLYASELFTMQLRSPYLAYLSACTTAVSSFGLLDESIHLASAFQLAGFPHVVATLWRIGDFVGADLAADFYQAVHPDADTWVAPALALHATVHAYRETYVNRPHVWASHIHFGP